jgi:hypothetical protein
LSGEKPARREFAIIDRGAGAVCRDVAEMGDQIEFSFPIHRDTASKLAANSFARAARCVSEINAILNDPLLRLPRLHSRRRRRVCDSVEKGGHAVCRASRQMLRAFTHSDVAVKKGVYSHRVTLAVVWSCPVSLSAGWPVSPKRDGPSVTCTNSCPAVP